MIALSQQEKRILDMVAPVAASVGMGVVRLRVTGGKRPGIQIMAEALEARGTSVEDCARLSRALSPVFELDEPLLDAYTLEVSTPGIDRPLTREGDFARWAGHLVKIELSQPIDGGQKRFTGMITGEDDAGVHIELDGESELVAHIYEMSKASLVLTDALIEAARAEGSLPPQGEDDGEGLETFEIDYTEETEIQDDTGDVL